MQLTPQLQAEIIDFLKNNLTATVSKHDFYNGGMNGNSSMYTEYSQITILLANEKILEIDI